MKKLALNGERLRRLIRSNQFTFAGIGAGLFFWILETSIHAYIFKHGTFIQEFFPTSDPNEIWMRSLVSVILIMFGACLQPLITRREKAEQALRKSHQELELIVEQRTAELVEANIQLQQGIGELRQTEEALQRAHDELEMRVEERTAELRSANEELQRSRELLQTVFDGISEPLVMLDSNLSIRMLNEAALRYYKIHDYKDVMGMPCSDILGKNSFSCRTCKIPQSLSKDNRLSFERKGFHDPGRLEQVVVYPIREESLGVTGCVMQISDITEQKRTEKQLIQADRLSSLGQLSGGIAHEIRNPLSAISLFVDILTDAESSKLTGAQLEILQEIKINIGKIDTIIRRILDFARESDGLMTEVDLNSLIEENLKLWYARMRKNKIKLDLSLENGLVDVYGDAIGIQQVVNNLIQNAVEAMGEDGGLLTISTSNGTPSIPKEGPVVTIKIQDTGSGIAPELQEKIFNPFFTTKALGTGLGLSISHQIVKRHAGVITCESNPDRPTIFTVELPVTTKDSEA